MKNKLEDLRNEIDKLIMDEEPDKLRINISHMYGIARFCTLLAIKRNMNIELAAASGMLLM